MSQLISVTPEEMEDRANSYLQQSEEIERVIGIMDGLLRDLQNEWKGNASEAYAQRYEELRPNFVSAQDLAKEISDALYKVAAQYRETDDALAQAVSG